MYIIINFCEFYKLTVWKISVIHFLKPKIQALTHQSINVFIRLSHIRVFFFQYFFHQHLRRSFLLIRNFLRAAWLRLVVIVPVLELLFIGIVLGDTFHVFHNVLVFTLASFVDEIWCWVLVLAFVVAELMFFVRLGILRIVFFLFIVLDTVLSINLWIFTIIFIKLFQAFYSQVHKPS